jgi:hypothetical protein
MTLEAQRKILMMRFISNGSTWIDAPFHAYTACSKFFRMTTTTQVSLTSFSDALTKLRLAILAIARA